MLKKLKAAIESHRRERSRKRRWARYEQEVLERKALLSDSAKIQATPAGASSPVSRTPHRTLAAQSPIYAHIGITRD